MDTPRTRYARSGDLSIAYQVFGEGDLDVVIVPGFISHLEMAWEIPFMRRPARGLARFARVLVFDKRGTGLSDRSLGLGTLEERMEDVHAVMDAAGIERAALIGNSEGGPMAILFAATYPERVSALVLHASYARIRWGEDHQIGTPPDALEERIAFIEPMWGQGIMMKFMIADAPDEAIPLLGRYERNACTPRMAAEIMQRNSEIDVRAALPAVSVPTLVVHTGGDPLVSVEQGRYLAEHIPGARYVEFPGETHMSWEGGNADRLVDEYRAFLTGTRDHQHDSDRILATVLFTDIVSSTEQAAAMGDRRWSQTLEEHDRLIDGELERHRGRRIKHTGDGVFAAFDGPARAVRCARAIVAQARLHGIEVRAGVHTGECETRGDDLFGMAVNIGSRIQAKADAGEVLVSSTVKDLVVGSGIEFEDRGEHDLKGVTDRWRLLAVTAA